MSNHAAKTSSPKPISLIVTGRPGCGKTTFMTSAAKLTPTPTPHPVLDSITQEHTAIAVADDLTVHVVIAQTLNDLKTLLEATHALGVLLLVDSTEPETLPETRRLYDRMLSLMDNQALVVAANKQDAAHAHLPLVLHRQLGFRLHVLTVPCVATDVQSVQRVLLVLAEKAAYVAIEEHNRKIEK